MQCNAGSAKQPRKPRRTVHTDAATSRIRLSFRAPTPDVPYATHADRHALPGCRPQGILGCETSADGVAVDADAEESRLSFASVPPTEGQRRAVLALIVAVVAAFCAITPFALVPLPRTDGYIPAVRAVISATDFFTAALLLGQHASAPSRRMLVLGCGYLFSALTVIAHTLTFPGAFVSTGLLGAGPQTAAWTQGCRLPSGPSSASARSSC